MISSVMPRLNRADPEDTADLISVRWTSVIFSETYSATCLAAEEAAAAADLITDL